MSSMTLTQAASVLDKAREAIERGGDAARPILARHGATLGNAVEAICAQLDHKGPDWIDEIRVRAESGDVTLDDLDRINHVHDAIRAHVPTKALPPAELGMDDWLP